MSGWVRPSDRIPEMIRAKLAGGPLGVAEVVRIVRDVLVVAVSIEVDRTIVDGQGGYAIKVVREPEPGGRVDDRFYREVHVPDWILESDLESPRARLRWQVQMIQRELRAHRRKVARR